MSDVKTMFRQTALRPDLCDTFTASLLLEGIQEIERLEAEVDRGIGFESRAKAAEHNFSVLLEENKALIDALQGWMMDHGDRCRICMDRSQNALKMSGRYDLTKQALDQQDDGE